MTDENGTAIAKRDPANGSLDIDRKLRNPEYMALIRDTYCKGATEHEFALAIETARHLRLDPTARQIFFIKRWDGSLGREVMSAQVSIDGLRLIAERTGLYAGQTEPQWCGPDGQWVNVWLQSTPPAAARVGVLRRDFEKPLYAVARYASYVQTKRDGKPNSMWAKMGDLMISKVAEALALRKAFPSEMSGAYTDDEVGQAANPSPAPTAQPAQTGNEAAFELALQALDSAKTMTELEAATEALRRIELSPPQRVFARDHWQSARDKIQAADAKAAEPFPAEPAAEPGPHDYGPPSWDNSDGGFGFGGDQNQT